MNRCIGFTTADHNTALSQTKAELCVLVGASGLRSWLQLGVDIDIMDSKPNDKTSTLAIGVDSRGPDHILTLAGVRTAGTEPTICNTA